MFHGIESSKDWAICEKINKGWSNDEKFYVETFSGNKFLLRISDVSQYDEKKEEYEIIKNYSSLGFEMSMPIEFGFCDGGQRVYMLCTWVEGVDLAEVLPTLSEEKQYELGREAGRILKRIHTLDVPISQRPVETKIAKKLHQLKRYTVSDVRVSNDEKIIEFIEENIHKMLSGELKYLHGDFHPRNLIFMPSGHIGVIDFNRWEIGDPYEEFYKLQSFGIEVSVPYCIGQVDAYFNDKIPIKFWEVLAVYVAHASLFSIVWATKFSSHDIEGMVNRCQTAVDHYNDFNCVIPSWYNQKKSE